MPKIHVERKITINASVEKIYPTVRDFRTWPVWSPWLIAEPDCEVTFTDDGTGYAWSGNVTGAGNMEIASEEEGRRIRQNLTFLKPWKSTADVRFDFVEMDGGVEVTWVMDSSLPFFMFFAKGMMEAFIGMDYERGLQMLKDYVETGAVASKLEFSGVEEYPGCAYVGVRTSCAIPEISAAMRRDMKRLCDSGVEATGVPFSIYHKWSPVKGVVDYTLAFPVAAGVTAEGLVSGSIPAMKVYAVKHTGPYRGLGNAWSAGVMHSRSKVFKQNRKVAPFETYENDPTEVEESELVTVVHLPVKG